MPGSVVGTGGCSAAQGPPITCPGGVYGLVMGKDRGGARHEWGTQIHTWIGSDAAKCCEENQLG